MKKKHPTYTIEGEEVPSVTTIIGKALGKSALYGWYAKHGFKAMTLLKEAGEYGSKIHKAIEDPSNHDEDAKEVAGLFWKMYHQKGFSEPILEQACYSNENLYAGTADMFFYDENGHFCLGDIKTSNSVHSSYDLQLAAYGYSDRCEHPDVDLSKIVRYFIFHFDKKLRQWSTIERTISRDTHSVFLALRAVYQWQVENKAL